MGQEEVSKEPKLNLKLCSRANTRCGYAEN
jgi:hypothetical protein